MEHLGFASAPAVLQYLKAAQDYGIEPEHALGATGITDKLLTDHSIRIKGTEFQALILHLIEQTQDPLFGLKSARYVQPGSYSILGYILMNCTNAGEAMTRTQSYETLVGDMGITHTEQQNELTRFYWTCQYEHPEVRKHMIDNVLGSWVFFARWLADQPDKSPVEVILEHPCPDAQQQKHYEEIFSCKVTFGAKASCIVVDDSILKMPIRQPDPQLLKTLEGHADILLANVSETQPLDIRCKNILRNLILEGIPRKDAVAAKLDMTARTLQRRLQQCDTSYQQILDDLRKDMALELLQDTTEPVQDIAYKLGFTEARSFHRSFKNWTGKTPSEFRQE